jgi:hypothetical protein
MLQLISYSKPLEIIEQEKQVGFETILSNPAPICLRALVNTVGKRELVTAFKKMFDTFYQIICRKDDINDESLAVFCFEFISDNPHYQIQDVYNFFKFVKQNSGDKKYKFGKMDYLKLKEFQIDYDAERVSHLERRHQRLKQDSLLGENVRQGQHPYSIQDLKSKLTPWQK